MCPVSIKSYIKIAESHRGNIACLIAAELFVMGEVIAREELVVNLLNKQQNNALYLVDFC